MPVRRTTCSDDDQILRARGRISVDRQRPSAELADRSRTRVTDDIPDLREGRPCLSFFEVEFTFSEASRTCSSMARATTASSVEHSCSGRGHVLSVSRVDLGADDTLAEDQRCDCVHAGPARSIRLRPWRNSCAASSRVDLVPDFLRTCLSSVLHKRVDVGVGDRDARSCGRADFPHHDAAPCR